MAEISYVPIESIDDPELRAYIELAARRGTPRPETLAIRAHQPEVLRTWKEKWERVVKGGIVDLELKELLRVHVATSLRCNY